MEETTQSYLERYKTLVKEANAKFEPQDATGTQILLICLTLLAAWVALSFKCNFDSEAVFIIGAVVMLGGIIFKAVPLITLNYDFKSTFMATMTPDEAPGVLYLTHTSVGIEIKDMALFYGKNLKISTEDYFKGSNYVACECKFETGGRSSEVLFKGYVWCIDTKTKLCEKPTYYSAYKINNTGFISPQRLVCINKGGGNKPYVYTKSKDDKPYTMDKDLWKHIQKCASAVQTGNFIVMAKDTMLCIAIDGKRDLFEMAGTIITEEMLAKTAADIHYVCSMPDKIMEKFSN